MAGQVSEVLDKHFQPCILESDLMGWSPVCVPGTGSDAK